jgi:hypothetical protein
VSAQRRRRRGALRRGPAAARRKSAVRPHVADLQLSLRPQPRGARGARPDQAPTPAMAGRCSSPTRSPAATPCRRSRRSSSSCRRASHGELPRDRRHHLLGGGRRRRGEDRRPALRVRAARHVRRAFMDASRDRVEGRDGALLLLRPPRPGSHGPVARETGMNAPDKAFLNKQYNNRELVPDHPQYFARWAGGLARARSTMTCHLDRRYGDMPGETLDIFPARKGDGTCLMFIHGGYWRSLDKSDHSFLAPRWVDAGVSLAVVNYDLCPKVTIEEIVQQMLRASRWLWLHAEDYGMDQDRLYVGGHSAGAHLTAMMMCALWPVFDAAPAEGPVEGRARHQRRVRHAAARRGRLSAGRPAPGRGDGAASLSPAFMSAGDARAGDDLRRRRRSRTNSSGRTGSSPSAGAPPSRATSGCPARTTFPWSTASPTRRARSSPACGA